MTAELPLRMPRGHARPGDASGRVLSPPELGRAICRRLAHYDVVPWFATEPSIGAGALAWAIHETWPGCFITGVDLDPRSEGFTLRDGQGIPIVHEAVVGDWPTVALRWEQDDLNLGNPPYHTTPKGGLGGVSWQVTTSHVNASRRTAVVSVQVLPVHYLATSTFLEAVPLPDALWPLLPRPWDRVREVAAFVWGLTGIPRLEPLRWKD